MEHQAFGIPVLTGPYMYSQLQLIECAKCYNAILQVSFTEVGPTIEKLLADSTLRQQLGKQSLKMVKELRGATMRTPNTIWNYLVTIK